MMLNERINFSVPITESAIKNNQDFIIKGTAINVGKTRNDTIFVEEELRSSASTLIGKPLLKDHEATIDNIVGKITSSVFNQNRIDFEAKVLDKQTQEKISMGLINSVSVGAMVNKVEKVFQEGMDETEDNFVGFKVMGIDFVELSLVAVPADPNAGFSQAIHERLSSSKSSPLTETKVRVEGNSTLITNDAHIIENVKMAEEKSKLELVQEEMEAVKLELATMQLDKMKAEKVKLLEEAEAEPEAEETPAEEVVKEEEVPVEDKTEGEVAEEPAEEKAEESYEVLSGSDTIGYGISQSYSKNESLTRLRREI